MCDCLMMYVAINTNHTVPLLRSLVFVTQHQTSPGLLYEVHIETDHSRVAPQLDGNLMVSFSKRRISRQSRRSSSSILGNLEVPVEALGSARLQLSPSRA